MSRYFIDTEFIEGFHKPFDPKFRDNYIEGKGKTKEEAMAQMQKRAEEISDSLWII